MSPRASSTLVDRRSDGTSAGVDAFLTRHVDHRRYYGSGKVALRDGLRAVAGDGDAVLLPAYVPDALPEPIRELGLSPRYYGIRDDLGPDLADLASRFDDGTVAVLSVNYFGFPQPDLATLSALVDDEDRYHVDDNAHSVLSVDDGRLLGTAGDVGIATLWKTLPVPDGALLYLTSAELRERFEPSRLAGVRDRFDGADARFLLEAFVTDVLGADDVVRRTVGALVDGRRAEGVPPPARRYAAAKARMSTLSARAIRRVDPAAVRERRRENYRAWLDVLAERADVDPLYASLPDGICPQSCPAYAEAPDRLLDDLASAGVRDAHTWPRLPPEVEADPSFETASDLARHVVSLPVHQRVDTRRIRTVGSQLVD